MFIKIGKRMGMNGRRDCEGANEEVVNVNFVHEKRDKRKNCIISGVAHLKFVKITWQEHGLNSLKTTYKIYTYVIVLELDFFVAYLFVLVYFTLFHILVFNE